MSSVRVVFYREEDGDVPVMNWLLTDVLRKDKKLFAWCFDAIEQLSEQGFRLQRPTAAPLREGIYELRVRYYRQNYRILYFFHGGVVAVLAHGLAKESKVMQNDIALALERKLKFVANPEAHTYYEEAE